MKKIKLTMKELDTPEVLNRKQLKNVLGGITVDQTRPCQFPPTPCVAPSGEMGICVTYVSAGGCFCSVSGVPC